MLRTNKHMRWLVASTLALTLAHGTVASAAGTLNTSASALAKGERTRYEEGKRAWDKADYAAAGQTWNGLLGRLPESPETRTVRASIILDVMAAYQAAYDGSGDVQMLRSGMDAYYGYFKAYRDAHGTSNIPDQVAQARHVMKANLAKAEGNGGGAPNNGGGAAPNNGGGAAPNNGGGAAPNNGGGAPNNGGGAAPNNGGAGAHGAAQVDQPRGTTPLIASGAVMLAIGLGATAMIGVGAVEGARAREDQKLPGYTDEQRARIDQRGRSMNALLITGAVMAPVFAITGVSLIIVGANNKRKAQLAFAPSVTRKFAGVVLRGRF